MALAAIVALTIGGLILGVAADARRPPKPVVTHLDFRHAKQPASGVAVYRGRVSVLVAEKRFCRKRREVQIYEKTANPDERLAKTYSDVDGRWRASSASPPKGHDLFAIVEAKIVRHSRVTYNCRPARSTSLAFPTP